MSFVTRLNRHVAPLIKAIGITPRSVTPELQGRISGQLIPSLGVPSEINTQESWEPCFESI
jgi:hypothetical protein